MVEIAFIDIERAIRDRDPQLGEMLVKYLAQSDPSAGKAELPTAADLDNDNWEYDDPDVPEGAMDLGKLRSVTGEYALRGKTATEKKLARREAFTDAVASPFTPPRLKLGDMLIALYNEGDAAGRAALAHVFAKAKLGWGVWKAIKAIYKLAEANHDIRMLGVIGCRFDMLASSPRHGNEIGAGTIIYIRRRVWRYLRQLGKAVPDAFPTFAVEILRHFPPEHGQYAQSWVAANIWGHKQLRGQRIATFRPPNSLDARAYPDTWKVSPAPLLRLLDQAQNDIVINFAIASLRADHPLALRAVEPAWLARLGRRPSAALHSFVVSLFKDSAELHQSRLRAVGLHDVVLSWLRSPAQDARAYALEYATAHAPDMTVAELIALLDASAEVVKFASNRLEQIPAQQIGAATLARLLRENATRDWATTKWAQAFRPSDLDEGTFVDIAVANDQSRAALVKLYGGNATSIPAAYLIKLLADERADYRSRPWALTELGKRTAADVGVAWIQSAIENREISDTVARWLKGDMLVGDKLDVDWVKGLVSKPRLRALALSILGDRRLITPARIGLDWLLEMARSADEEVHTFAHRLLLEHFAPEDFAGPGASRAAGIDRLYDLAAGKGRSEQVRAFAHTYLRAHHPVIGLTLAEAKQLGIKPKLLHSDYPLSRIRPLFGDDRADVRRFAAQIAAQEVARWGEPDLVYELAGAAYGEARRLGIELLLSLVAPPDAAPGTTERIPAAWLDGRQLFALAESPHKGTREAALTLIRRAYDRVGGAERLAWLMESPERDVRLFAVRLFWDRHRPRPVPEDYKPPRDVGAPLGGERFADTDALRQFLRTILLGLPPGRLEQRDALPGGAMPERPLAASIAKRRLVEAVRELGEADAEFARVLAPVIVEMSASVAKGEWQACVAALAAMRIAHPDLGNFGLPAPRPFKRPTPPPRAAATGRR
jgi:hypothetical protein